MRLQSVMAGLMCAMLIQSSSDVSAAKRPASKAKVKAAKKVVSKAKTSSRQNAPGVQQMDGITILSSGGEYAMPSRPAAPRSALRRTAATLPSRISSSSPLGHRHGNYDTRSIAPITSSPAREVDGKLFPPQFETLATDGQPINLNQYRGKIVLLDFWGTWCPPSRDETPALVPLYQKFRSAGFEIVGISLDTRRSEMDSFVRKHNLRLNWQSRENGTRRCETPLKKPKKKRIRKANCTKCNNKSLYSKARH